MDAIDVSAAPDAAILDAWERRKAAYNALNALPIATGKAAEALERARWATVDAAEEEIRAATAQTPRGAYLQLMVALGGCFTNRDLDNATINDDLPYLIGREHEFDLNARFIVSALCSLKSMEAGHGRD